MSTEEDFTLYPVTGWATTGEEGLIKTYSSLTELVFTLLFLLVILTFTVSGKAVFTHYFHRQWFCKGLGAHDTKSWQIGTLVF